MRASQFERDTMFIGIDTVAWTGTALVPRYALQSWIGPSATTPMHKLVVEDRYEGEWRFWESASGSDATPLEFVEGGRDVEACTGVRVCVLFERFAATIPDSILRAHRTGYAIKFYARSGAAIVLTLSAHQIEAQLVAIDKARGVAQRH